MGGLIFELIPKIMGEIGAIGKNGTNTYDNYKFRSIDDVYNKVQPVLARNGVFFKPTVLESNESTVVSQKGASQVRIKQKVEYTFFAKDGSSFTTVVEGEAIDRGDKATNKAMTAALKYMLIQVFCIAIEGQDDADKESPDVGEMKQKSPQNKISNEFTAKINDLVKACANYRVTKNDICARYDINDINELTQEHYNDLVSQMRKIKDDKNLKDKIFPKAG